MYLLNFLLLSVFILSTNIRVMGYEVEIIPQTKDVILGEGPHWDVATQTLYFVDIPGGSINSYTPSSRTYRSAVIGDGSIPVTMIIPLKGKKNKFIISVKNDLAVVTWNRKSNPIPLSKLKIIARAEQVETQRFNDGKADAKGRIWAGTMHVNNPEEKYPPVGALYRIDNNASVTPIFREIHISNGLTWNRNNDKFYYIDSSKYRIESYDYNITAGDIDTTTEKIVYDFKASGTDGLPDGMTIDKEGNLYVATYGAGRVLKIDPKGKKILQEFIINEAVEITSVAFGGRHLNELYVTTAKIIKKKGEDDKVNGYLYKIKNLGATGIKMNSARLI